jgi:predicted NUDIX family NTP pyrophosphohydrolase
MPVSAGLLLYRHREGALEVLLVHPGGPYWRRKDAGAWSIPKGAIEPGESPLAAARREFREETGGTVDGDFLSLGTCRQKGGKEVHAFAVEGDFDPDALVSNAVVIEWPPRSGRLQSFPEVDRAAWYPIVEARSRLNPAQCVFLDLLAQAVEGGS